MPKEGHSLGARYWVISEGGRQKRNCTTMIDATINK